MCDHPDTPTFPPSYNEAWCDIKRRLDRALDGLGPTIQPTTFPAQHIHAALKHSYHAYDNAAQLQRCPTFKAQDLSVDLNEIMREMGNGPPFEYKSDREVDLLTSDLAGLELCKVIAKVVYTKWVTEKVWERIGEVQSGRYERGGGGGFDECL